MFYYFCKVNLKADAEPVAYALCKFLKCERSITYSTPTQEPMTVSIQILHRNS